MSLLTFGFSKEKGDIKSGVVHNSLRQEAVMVSPVSKMETKTPVKVSPKSLKSPLKSSPMNASKTKKETKSPPKCISLKSSLKKESPMSNSKMTPKGQKDMHVSSKVKLFSIEKKVSHSPSDESNNKKSDNCLPSPRIKLIMKSCPDVDMVSNESLHVMSKATELFIQHLTFESLGMAKRPILDYECLSAKVYRDDSLEFLKETVPKKITFGECKRIIAEKQRMSKEL